MKYLAYFVIFLAGLILAGCSGDSMTTAPQNNNGNTTDVPKEVAELLETNTPDGEEVVIEAVAGGYDFIPDEFLDSCDIYSITFLWGSFCNTMPPAVNLTDWSGKLWVNGLAYVHPHVTIDFEPNQDYIIEENIHESAAWVSYVSTDFDGIHFLVFLKKNVIYITPPWLTYESEQIKLELPFEKLNHYMAFYPTSNGQALAVLAHRVWINKCSHGTVKGRWLKDKSGLGSGSFHGHWINHLGIPIGYLDGYYWINNDNIGEFAGSITGLTTDQILGEVYGYWRYDDPRDCILCGEGHGIFAGKFVMNESNVHGYLGGTFGDYSLPPDDLDMPFSGVWKARCNVGISYDDSDVEPKGSDPGSGS
jgi:hypothetical protein